MTKARATPCPASFHALARMISAALVDEIGLNAALIRLMAPNSEYRKGELYVFVIDRRGILRAGRFGGGVGMDLTGTRDAKGRFFVKQMLRVAERRGQGWVAYAWVDPCTGQMAEKQTFVKRAGEYIVAAGVYSVHRV